MTRCRAIDLREDRSTLESHFRLGFIIPTMNRLEPLNRLLGSIYAQTVLPEAFIIVDGSDEPLERNTPGKVCKSGFAVGDLEMVDRFYFVKKFPEHLSYPAAVWAGIWVVARNLRLAVLGWDRIFLFRTYSNIRALIRCSFGRVERFF